MAITPTAAPPVGVTPGDLRVDSASRTLWLGVDPAVDPDGAILISDIEALEAELNAVEAAANAYTDSQIVTRAPTVHHHVAADVTDFAASVTAVVAGIPGFNWVAGMILMWSGSLVEIGVGDLHGWALCDGGGVPPRPDLRSKFILGAGHVAVKAENPLAAAPTQPAGNHAHGGKTADTTLALTQIPGHVHADGTLAGLANGNTGSGGAHTHAGGAAATQNARVDEGSDAGSAPSFWRGAETATAAANPSTHTHPIVNVAVSVSGNTASAGGGGPHNHTIPNEGDHVHTITSNNIRDAAPYYALAFIIKLP